MTTKRYPNKQQVNFRLTRYCVEELKDLSEELDTNMSAIVERAIALFAYDLKRGVLR